MSLASSQFWNNAQLILPADSLVSRDIGSKKCLIFDLNKHKGSIYQCPFCHTLLVPAVCSMSTISKNKLKKMKKQQHFPVYSILSSIKLSNAKHFIKIHCKICSQTHLVPCGRSSQSNNSTQTSHSTLKVTPTPQRRRRSHDLKKLIYQTTPKTPPTPSLMDFLLDY